MIYYCCLEDLHCSCTLWYADDGKWSWEQQQGGSKMKNLGKSDIKRTGNQGFLASELQLQQH